MMTKKTLYWVGTSLDDLKGFPLNIKRDAGYQLDRVQSGNDPDDWKPMKTVGAGVREIRLKGTDGIYRIFYVVVTDSSVYVLHAFKKTSQKTPKKDIDKCINRFKEVMRTK